MHRPLYPGHPGPDPTVRNVTSFPDLGAAPHMFGNGFRQEIAYDSENIISKIKIGDYFKVEKRVGGGGGHRLIIKNFQITTVMFRLAMKKKK